jgi:hypothetical protein
MQRSLLAVLLLAGFLAGAIGLSYLFFHGGPAGDPSAALPAGVSAALVIPSLPSLMRNLSTTRMAAAPGGDEWRLFSEILSELLDARGLALDVDPSILAKGLRGGAALGWIPPERQGASPGLILALEISSINEDFLGFVERSVLPGLAGGAAIASRRAHRGHAYLVVRVPGSASVICVTSWGRLALVTLSRDAMRRALSTLMRHDPALIDDPSFRALKRDLAERSDLLAYGSGDFVRGLFATGAEGDVAGEGWRNAIASSERILGAGVSITISREGLFRERVRILIPGIADTLLGEIFGGRPGKIEIASRLPAGYPFYAGATFSHTEAVWDRLPGWLGPVAGEAPARLRSRLLGLEEFLGLDFRRDLFSVVGDQIAVAIDPRGANPFVIALRPSDSAAVRRLLSRMDGLARAAEAYRASTAGGGRITTYEYPRLAPLRPSYLFGDDALLISGAPEALDRNPSTGSGGDPPPAFDAPPAHLALRVDTEEALLWIRGIADRGSSQGRSQAWLRRLQDLLPGASGPLPPLTATFSLNRDGISGEWSSPLSPVILTTLLLASPGSQEETPPPQDLPDVPAPPDGG